MYSFAVVTVFFLPSGCPQYQLTPLVGWAKFQSQILKMGDQKKMSAWGDLNSSCHGHLPGGLLCFLSKKETFKIKYSSDGSMLILACFSQKKNQCLVLGYFSSVKSLE